jgi:hypothetical protein
MKINEDSLYLSSSISLLIFFALFIMLSISIRNIA